MSDLANELRKFSGTALELDSSRCLNQRHKRRGQCQLCATACPTDAISLAPAPEIDGDRCNGCAACAAVCPVSALQERHSISEVWANIQSAAKREGEICLACKAIGAGHFSAFRIACIAALPAEFYIGLAVSGLPDIRIYTDDCAECPLRSSLNQAQQAIEDAEKFLDTIHLRLNLSQQIGHPPLMQEKQYSISRRDFIRRLFAPTTVTVNAHQFPDKSSISDVGWRRALLYEALSHLSLSDDVSVSTYANHWGSIAINTDCTGCQMCIQFCPNGALRSSVESNGEVTLWHDAARCAACGLCQRICYRNAIEFGEVMSLSALAASHYVPVWRGHPPATALNKRRSRHANIEC